MTKLRLDVIQHAHRILGILAADQEATADQEAYAGEVLDAVFAEVNTVEGLGFTWDLTAIPDEAFLGLSGLLASEIAPHYGLPAAPRSRSIARLRAYALPDDRADWRDFDEDGTVSTEEAAAAERSLYY